MKLNKKVVFTLVLATPLIVQAGTTKSVDPTKPETVSAKVTNVIDGDTVEIKIGKSTETLRLDAIDAPDVALESGVKAKDALEKLVLNKSVKAVIAGRVALGQGNVKTLYTFGNLKVGATDVELEQVIEGNALVFHQNPNASADLLKAEDIAKSQNLGFWAELGSNEALQNWVDSAIPDASAQSIDTIDTVNYAAENARDWRQIGWGKLPDCIIKVVDGGRTCKYIKWPWPARGGKNICWPNAPKLETASQKWTVDINEPTQQRMQQIVLSRLVLDVDSTAAGNTMNIVKAAYDTVKGCTVTALAAAGISSFFVSPAGAPVVFNGSFVGCVTTTYPIKLAAEFTGVSLPATFDDLKSRVIPALTDLAKEYQFRAGTSCNR